MSRLPRVLWAYSTAKDAYIMSGDAMERLLEQVYREGVDDGARAALAAAAETACTDEPDIEDEIQKLPF